MVREKSATTMESFVKIVKSLKGDLWFRGQANSEWTLTPRLYRGLADIDPRAGDDETREYFIRVGGALTAVKPTDEWDWYFVMQHHGAPTRLLDWTESPQLALFFAVRDNEGYNDAAVWAFDPWRLNGKVAGGKEVLPPGDPGLTKQDRKRYERWLIERFAKKRRWPRYPVAVYPRHSMRRIAAQRSCFTVHGSDPRGLQEILPRLGVPLVKITIPSWSVASIQAELEDWGVDETTVFPDLDGLGRDLAQRAKKAERDRPHDDVYTRLRASKIDKGGVGVFATKGIRKGTALFKGEPEEMAWLDKSALSRLPQVTRKLYDDFAVIKTDSEGKTRYGCPPSFNRLTVSWFLNHSSKPNVRCDKNFNFFALHDITTGEELTVNYSTYSERPGRWVDSWWTAPRPKQRYRAARRKSMPRARP